MSSDTPYGQLPGAAQVVLADHKIEVAVAEVRFNYLGALRPQHGLALQSAVAAAGAVLTTLEQTRRQDLSVTFGAQGAASTTVVDEGWVLSSADRSLTVTLFPDLAFVQSTAYTRFSESLLPTLRGVLAALADQFAPELVQRVGLRYINRLTDADAATPTAWRERITPSILGAISDESFAHRVTGTQQQIEMALEPGVGAVIRHGAFVDPGAGGAYSYLVDLDVFNGVAVAFDPDAVVMVATRLNRTVLALFQQVVLPDFRGTMGPSPAYALEGP